MRLFSQVSGEADIARAWLAHYRRLGVTEFHLVLHGPQAQNRIWQELAAAGEVLIEAEIDEPSVEADRVLRLSRLAARYAGEWVWVADADEFVELPFEDVAQTCAALDACGVEALSTSSTSSGGDVWASTLAKRLRQQPRAVEDRDDRGNSGLGFHADGRWMRTHSRAMRNRSRASSSRS